MMLFDGDIKVHIDINKNGAYVLGCESSSGKTYLAGLCRSLSTTLNNTFNVITYIPGADENIYLQLLEKKCKVCVVDRYDMFASDALSEKLESLGNKCILLVDCKNTNLSKQFKAKRAGIVLTKDEVKVYEINTCFRR